MSAQRHTLSGARRNSEPNKRERIEMLWASGKSSERICELTGCSREEVGRVVTLLTGGAPVHQSEPEDHERHVAAVLAARPEGFPARYLPAKVRIPA